MTLSRSKMSVLVYVIALVTIIAGILASLVLRGATPHAHAAKAEASGGRLVDCAESSFCTEVADPASAFPGYEYVGHDEPSNLFYSNVAGSGNNNQWRLKLPSDPTPKSNGEPKEGQSFNFQLHPAFWFGMAMCDTQSYPEQVSTCTPDSDNNIVDPAVSPNHPGTAFMEMQFYPPGWVAPEFVIGTSCTAKQWCAAITIDSLAEDPIKGTTLNSTCANQLLGGLEYINFALITKSGVPQAPADPLHSTLASFTADPAKDLLMNSGDNIEVTMHDTNNGLNIVLNDLTTSQSGSMTASAANGFGQIQYDPTGTSCNVLPYDFHPMYSTSSEATRVIWAAHSYNVAFSDEIGHFDYCTAVTGFGGNCLGQEGLPPSLYTPGDLEPADGDDLGCFSKHSSTLVKVTGCTFTNSGFDGVPYQNLWPDGNPLHPTPIQFSSPLTGLNYDQNYSRSAFEADLPRIEDPTVCHRLTDGSGCTLIPTTDDNHAPAVFYPYYSITSASLGITTCAWQLGSAIPGSITDFGKNNQYGSLLPLVYLTFGGGGSTNTRFNNFRQIFANNPCLASIPG
jgi:hypothetical protein